MYFDQPDPIPSLQGRAKPKSIPPLAGSASSAASAAPAPASLPGLVPAPPVADKREECQPPGPSSMPQLPPIPPIAKIRQQKACDDDIILDDYSPSVETGRFPSDNLPHGSQNGNSLSRYGRFYGRRYDVLPELAWQSDNDSDDERQPNSCDNATARPKAPCQ
jgi:hypothetical protein